MKIINYCVSLAQEKVENLFEKCVVQEVERLQLVEELFYSFHFWFLMIKVNEKDF